MDLALQFYTVRRYSRRNLKNTIEMVREIGITNFEMARIALTEKNLEILKTATENGISITSHQLRYQELVKEGTIDFLKGEKCRRAVLSVIPAECIGNERKFRLFLMELGSLSEKYRENGITLCYHHHNYEALDFGSGRTGFEILLEMLPEIDVKLIVDTYWLQRSGLSPVAFIEKHGSIIEGLHLRDYKVGGLRSMPRERDALPPGGVLDIRGILEEAARQGLSYYALEADTRTPFEDIRLFMDYRKNELKEI